jgi:hypothetical protein
VEKKKNSRFWFLIALTNKPEAIPTIRVVLLCVNEVLGGEMKEALSMKLIFSIL